MLLFLSIINDGMENHILVPIFSSGNFETIFSIHLGCVGLNSNCSWKCSILIMQNWNFAVLSDISLGGWMVSIKNIDRDKTIGDWIQIKG